MPEVHDIYPPDPDYIYIHINPDALKKTVYKIACAATGALLGGICAGALGRDFGRWIVRGGFDPTFLIMPHAPTNEAIPRWSVIGAIGGAILGFQAGWDSATIICNYARQPVEHPP